MRAATAIVLLLGAATAPLPAAAPSVPAAAQELAPPTTRELTLTAGAHSRLTFDRPISRIAIGKAEVAEAKVTGRTEIVLLGKSPGRTSLIVWLEDAGPESYELVVPVDLDGLARRLAADPSLARIAVQADSQRVTLSGYVASAEDHARAMRLVSARAGKTEVVDEIRVLQQQMVSVEVRFAAMSANTLKKLGFDFSVFGRGFQVATTGPNSGATFEFTPGTGLGLTSGLPIAEAFNLFLAAPRVDLVSVLGALSGTRLAQVLAEPTLIVRSGESAEFISGGEIPVPVPQQEGTVGIEYRKFGIQLRLAATVLSPDRIALHISPEVSDLDFSRGVSIAGAQIPALTTRGATTTLELGDGQTFVMAGLMSSSQSDSEERVPFLGSVPILGAFFKRVDNTRERQELVIVATPRLVRPMETSRLPRPPGADLSGYDPSFGELLLDSAPLDDALLSHGLVP